MRRVVAISLLALIALFLGATGADACDEAGRDCPPGCHVSCRDGCGAAPLTEAERVLPAAALVAGEPAAAAPSLLDRTAQPETAPPRS